MKRINYHCSSCGNVVPFIHLHDTAHGIAATHMAGSERFKCTACDYEVYSRHQFAFHFPFIFDGQPAQTAEIKPK